MDSKKENKRYYWLKLQSTYFNQLEQKKMKKQENGKEMQIVYLRMMLSSIDKGGYIYYQGVFDTLEEELAEEFNEDIEIIRKTLEYLQTNNMISINENSDCFIPEVLECTGSEGYSAERMRRMRNKNKTSQCDTNVTCSDEELEKEQEKEKETELVSEKDDFTNWEEKYTVKVTKSHFEYLQKKYPDIEGMIGDDCYFIEPRYCKAES